MKRQGVVLVDEEALTESEIEFCVLCISDVEERILPCLIHLGMSSACNAVEQVARSFQAEANRIGIRPVIGSSGAERP